MAVNCKAPAVPSSLQATVEAVASVIGSLIYHGIRTYTLMKKTKKNWLSSPRALNGGLANRRIIRVPSIIPLAIPRIRKDTTMCLNLGNEERQSNRSESQHLKRAFVDNKLLCVSKPNLYTWRPYIHFKYVWHLLGVPLEVSTEYSRMCFLNFYHRWNHAERPKIAFDGGEIEYLWNGWPTWQGR